MKLNWKGHGCRVHDEPIKGLQARPVRGRLGNGAISLAWNWIPGQSTYSIISTHTGRALLFIRVLDDMGWQDAAPRIFEPTLGEMEGAQ